MIKAQLTHEGVIELSGRFTGISIRNLNEMLKQAIFSIILEKYKKENYVYQELHSTQRLLVFTVFQMAGNAPKYPFNRTWGRDSQEILNPKGLHAGYLRWDRIRNDGSAEKDLPCSALVLRHDGQ
jgi:hypothetical protein